MQSLFDVKQEPKFPNSNGWVVKVQLDFGGIFCDFFKIVKTGFKEIILKNWQKFIVSIYSENKVNKKLDFVTSLIVIYQLKM